MGSRQVGTSPGEAIGDSVSAIANRPTFKHSVIPGGVGDAPELASAIARDQVVAEHYRGIDAATMRPQTLSADQLAFVSYRIGDRIYWTKQRVRISAGETVLTNGETTIRARCGNCISLEPMLPTADDEPELADLDALVGADRILTPWDLNPVVAETPVVVDSASSAEPATGGAAGGLVLFPLIGGSSPGATSDQTDLIVAPDDFRSYAELVEDDPFSNFLEDPFTDLLADPFDDPPSSLFLFDPGLDDFSDPDDSDPGSEEFSPALTPTLTLTPFSAPTPVPEPGTFVLVGSAMAGLLARRWRARKHQ